jgi:uncharacterized protein YbjT (DUF2867 family)
LLQRVCATYPYHAGFGNEGFLYGDARLRTLVWSTFDPVYEALIGRVRPWALGPDARAIIEAALQPAPGGGHWRFRNPPRSVACGEPIGPSIADGIYYLIDPESVILEPPERRFAQVLRSDLDTAS